MSNTINMIKQYIPSTPQEEKDKQFFIDCESKGQILTRDNEQYHLTSSAFITNKTRDKVLCTYHKIYNSWTWVGGHADGDDDMLYVAKKETEEETSIHNFSPILSTPISIESLPVLGHFKKGKYVPAHIHLNVTYLFVADETENLQSKPDENTQVTWLTFEELINKSSEEYMKPVYKKIVEKIKMLNL